MNVLDLFSGIGGFSLGLERAGFNTVAFCEIEKYPRKILHKHWPDVPIYEDVRTLSKDKLNEDGITDIGLICGGFPCQPVSSCGKRMGSEDHRWLWPEYFRLIKELRPAWVIGENVAGIISMELDNVLADLESISYSTRTFDIRACSVGLPTLERHIWIIATTTGKRLQGSKTNKNKNHRKEGEFQGADPRISRRWHLPESRVCRSRKGVPNLVDRDKALGNAVPPKIPEIIGRAIMEVEA